MMIVSAKLMRIVTVVAVQAEHSPIATGAV